MIRLLGHTAVFVLLVHVNLSVAGDHLPPRPDWQTSADNCSWHWEEGGGIGLWTEVCTFHGMEWRVSWDEEQAAFVTRSGAELAGVAVQPWRLPASSGIDALTKVLEQTGNLSPDAPCEWRSIALRPAPRTMAFFVLAPIAPDAFAPTPLGEIPEPLCGPYGASTHGVRYFIVDLRWQGRAIFVDEGQERPLFDPASITMRTSN
jgi:hypothetical protein